MSFLKQNSVRPWHSPKRTCASDLLNKFGFCLIFPFFLGVGGRQVNPVSAELLPTLLGLWDPQEAGLYFWVPGIRESNSWFLPTQTANHVNGFKSRLLVSWPWITPRSRSPWIFNVPCLYLWSSCADSLVPSGIANILSCADDTWTTLEAVIIAGAVPICKQAW